MFCLLHDQALHLNKFHQVRLGVGQITPHMTHNIICLPQALSHHYALQTH